MRQFIINNKAITDKSEAYVIAEIGHNHMGDIDICLQMIDAAKRAGASAVKLQRINAKRLFTEKAFNEPYNSENAFADTYGRHREYLTLSDNDFGDAREAARSNGLDFICTAFEEDSVYFLRELNIDCFKLASFHLRDYALVDEVIKSNKPVIVSTGGSTFFESIDCISDIMQKGAKIAVLQCTSAYPNLDYKTINLGVIGQYRKTLPVTIIGYSHHHPSIKPAYMSYAYGARIVEVHFTLNRAWKGTDQSFSVEESQLADIVKNLRACKDISGDKKVIYDTEIKPLRKMSRGIYAKRPIIKGQKISEADLIYKAPLTEFATKDARIVIGKVAKMNIMKDAPIISEVLA